MENVADALKMAGAVLLFVLALSIIILSFGQVRESADTIMDYRDRETSYINGDYYYESTDEQVRKVDQETIIPSVYRAYLEGYTIVFDGFNPLYNYNNEDKYILGKEDFLANSNSSKRRFIEKILYGKSDFDMNGISFEEGNELTKQLENKKNINEYIGIYYENDDENVPDVNKRKKRIITYRVENE